MSRRRKAKRSVTAAVPPDPVPPAPQPEAPKPAVVANDMPAVPPAAVANGALVAVAIAFGAALQQLFAPRLASTPAVVVPIGAAFFAFGIFKFFFDREYKTFVRKVLLPRATRIVVCSVLAVEVLLTAFLASRPPARIVRLVPGPELNIQLGHAGQRLRVDLDGARFEIGEPHPRAFYAGAAVPVVQERVRGEDPLVREAVLNDILRVIYHFEDPTSIRTLRDEWLVGGPKILQRTSGEGRGGLAAVLIDGKTETELKVQPIEAEDAIETYVIEWK